MRSLLALSDSRPALLPPHKCSAHALGWAELSTLTCLHCCTTLTSRPEIGAESPPALQSAPPAPRAPFRATPFVFGGGEWRRGERSASRAALSVQITRGKRVAVSGILHCTALHSAAIVMCAPRAASVTQRTRPNTWIALSAVRRAAQEYLQLQAAGEEWRTASALLSTPLHSTWRTHCTLYTHNSARNESRRSRVQIRSPRGEERRAQG